MEQLKYHQATYDLLTKQRIDPQQAIDHYERTHAWSVRSYFQKELQGEALEDAVKKHRNEHLAWTEIELYQRPIRFSEENVYELDAIERKYRVKLPEAIREWYSLDIMPEIMSATEWGYRPISDLKPLPEHDEWADSSRIDLWFFLFSEYLREGGDTLTFKIDAGDDPPVYAESANDYVRLDDQFSNFIYLHFWDWLAHYTFEYGFSIRYELGLGDLQSRTRHTVPFSRLAQFQMLKGAGTVRYFDEHTRIWPDEGAIGRMQYNDPPDAEPMVRGGLFLADSLDALKGLIQRIWGDHAPVFEMDTFGVNKESAELIDQMQKDLLRRVLVQSADWVTQRDLAFMLGARFDNLSTTMWNQLKGMIERGEAEAHPDNTDQRPQWLDNRYRIVRA